MKKGYGNCVSGSGDGRQERVKWEVSNGRRKKYRWEESKKEKKIVTRHIEGD